MSDVQIAEAEPTLFDTSREDEDVLHWYSPEEYPWAYCGKFIGDAEDNLEDDVDCPLCIEINRQYE